MGFRKINKQIFTKLYRYYWQKILRKWLTLALSLVMVLIVGGTNFYLIKLMEQCETWQQILTGFFLLSVFQLLITYLVISPVVSELVGQKFEAVAGSFLRQVKKDSTDDLKVLVFTPNVDRETMILAKFALAFTIFWVVSFLVIALPIFCYLFTFSNLSLPLNFLFLLLSGTVWAIQDFLLVVPSSFYFAGNYSFARVLLSTLYLIFVSVSFVLFWFLCRYFVFAMFLFLPFSFLVGWSFWSLYCSEFLKKDIN